MRRLRLVLEVEMRSCSHVVVLVREDEHGDIVGMVRRGIRPPSGPCEAAAEVGDAVRVAVREAFAHLEHEGRRRL